MSSDSPPDSPIYRFSVERLVRIACFGSLVSMGFIAWSVLDPTPFPVMISMSLGQAIGTIALACYTLAVLIAQTRRPDKHKNASVDPGPKQ